VPGHEGAFEHTVEQRPGYTVVRKDRRAGEIAESTDPRD
jgi:hypothetical protein